MISECGAGSKTSACGEKLCCVQFPMSSVNVMSCQEIGNKATNLLFGVLCVFQSDKSYFFNGFALICIHIDLVIKLHFQS